MLSESIRILNLDDSVVSQRSILSQYKAEILDLTDLGPKARFWMNRKSMQAIEERLQGTEKNCVTFLGSGDFHQVSYTLIKQFEQPLTVIDFDFHPDWDTSPPCLGCGSWVTQTLKEKNVLKFILIGTSSDDISSWWVQSGNLSSLKDDRVEIYPYSHKPSLAFFKKIPENVSLKLQKGLFFTKIYWNGFRGRNLTDFFLPLLKRVPTKQVYVSIDKDCLKKEYALTNWEEGLLTLDELFNMLKLIKDNLDIVGMDITGDYSRISISGKLKSILSKLDHPKKIEAAGYPESAITAINEETNLKILELLNS